MDLTTVSFVCSVILCILSVCTFITGMTSRSKQDGQIIAKLDYAVKAIEEIKVDSRSVSADMGSVKEDIVALKVKVSNLNDRVTHIEDGGAVPA